MPRHHPGEGVAGGRLRWEGSGENPSVGRSRDETCPVPDRRVDEVGEEGAAGRELQERVP